MPGRLRTASRPSSTVIDSESYEAGRVSDAVFGCRGPLLDAVGIGSLGAM